MILGEAFYRRAVQNVSEHLKKREHHAMLVLDPVNVEYLSGLSLLRSDRPVAVCVWSTGDAALFVPQLEAEHAGTSWIRDIRWYAEHPAPENPVRWMARESGGPLLVDDVDHSHWIEIAEEQSEIAPTAIVERLRASKSSTEVDLIQEAATYADQAVERTFARLTSGVSERELLADVCHRIEEEILASQGAQHDERLPVVGGRVVSGTRAAFPGAATSTRTINRGDVVIAEYTVTIGGYHAVAGTTFFVGDPLRDIVSTVNACVGAQEALRSGLEPGNTAAAIFQDARRVLERAGLGNAVKHRPAQGIGLTTAEAPWIVRGCDDEMKAGMVLVNQPGAYLSGRTGVRQAETVLVEQSGSRVLNPGIRRWDNPEVRLKEF